MSITWTITEKVEEAMQMYDPPHPGKLIADILENGELAIGSTVEALAAHLRTRPEDLMRVVQGEAGIDADIALRLQDALGVNAEMWLRLQNKRDLWVASQTKRDHIARVSSKAA